MEAGLGAQLAAYMLKLGQQPALSPTPAGMDKDDTADALEQAIVILLDVTGTLAVAETEGNAACASALRKLLQHAYMDTAWLSMALVAVGKRHQEALASSDGLGTSDCRRAGRGPYAKLLALCCIAGGGSLDYMQMRRDLDPEPWSGIIRRLSDALLVLQQPHVAGALAEYAMSIADTANKDKGGGGMAMLMAVLYHLGGDMGQHIDSRLTELICSHEGLAQFFGQVLKHGAQPDFRRNLYDVINLLFIVARARAEMQLPMPWPQHWLPAVCQLLLSR